MKTLFLNILSTIFLNVLKCFVVVAMWALWSYANSNGSLRYHDWKNCCSSLGENVSRTIIILIIYTDL